MAVQPQILSRQVMPDAAAPMPLERPESLGAGLAAGGAQLADALQRRDISDYRIQREANATREAADWAHRFALHRQNMDGITRQLRSTAQAGGQGHEEAVRAAHEAAREAMFAGITEDRLRLQALEQWDSYTTGLLGAEAGFAEGRRVEKLRQDVTALTDIGANRIRTGAADLNAFAQEMELAYGAIDAMQLPEDTKQGLRRELVDQKYAIAWLNQLNETNPQLALSALEAGTFNEVLTPQQLEQARSGAQVEIRAQEAAARRQEAEAKAMVMEQVQVLQEMVRQGIQVPDDQLAQATATVAQLGDTSLALKLDGVRADNAHARVWGNGNASPLQRQQRLQELARKSEGRSPGEDREYKWLQDNSGRLDSQFDADPVAAIAAVSGAPALDWNSPASIAKRTQWARAQRQATGRDVPILSGAEAQQLREALGSEGGRRQVLATLDRIADPVEQIRAARFLAPEDRMLHRLAGLQPQFRQTVQMGAQALNANKALLKVAEGDAQFDVLDRMQRQMNQALIAVEPEERAAILETARMYLAGRLDAFGRDAANTSDEVLDRMISQAMTVALGGRMTRDAQGNLIHTGGLSTMNGTAFFVEDGYTMPQLMEALVADRLRQDRAGTGPINPFDNSPADLKRAYPVWVGGGMYRWETAPGVRVKRKDGRDFISQVELRQ
jgi:hypothetical protein